MADNFNLQEALKDAVSPIDTATQVNLSRQSAAAQQQRDIQKMAIENQFVTARNAGQIAMEARNRAEEEKQRLAGASALSKQENQQAIARNQAELSALSDAKIRDTAQQVYKLPIHDNDGKLIPTDELVQNIADAAGKQAKNLHGQIASNNAKLAGISIPLPDIRAAAASAARNIAADPIIASQVSPDIMNKVQALVANQSTNPLGLSTLIYNKEHGLGSTLESWLPGQSGRAQAAIIQGALQTEMDKQIAAQTNIKSQQAMFQMKSIAQQNEMLQSEYAKHFAAASPETQQNLLSPDAVTNAAVGRNAASPDPADYNPLKPAPQAPVAAPAINGIPDTSSPPSPITEHLQNQVEARAHMQRAQDLADRLGILQRQKNDIDRQIGAGLRPQYTPGSEPGVANVISAPIQPEEQLQLSKQSDNLGRQIEAIKKSHDAETDAAGASNARILGVPQAPTPTGPPPPPPSGQPQANAPAPATLQLMTQLANADGMQAPQIQAMQRAAMAGNPQAAQTIHQYRQRAESVLASQNNPFASSASPSTSQTSPASSLTSMGGDIGTQGV